MLADDLTLLCLSLPSLVNQLPLIFFNVDVGMLEEISTSIDSLLSRPNLPHQIVMEGISFEHCDSVSG